MDDTSSFPGWRVMFDVREHKPRLRDIEKKANFGPDHADFLEALLYGHYLKCVARAVETVADASPFQSSVFERAFEKSHAGGLSMVNQRPSPVSNMHIDPGDLVLNIPLADGFEDTSTAFYKTQSGQEQCIGDEDAMRACRNSIDKHTTFSVVQDHQLSTLPISGPCVDVSDQCVEWAAGGRCPADVEEMHRDCKHSCGVCGGLWLGRHNPPTGQDHSGAFEKHHEVPFKMNRLVLYSGHLFHSSYISRDALIRIEQAFEVCLLKVSTELQGCATHRTVCVWMCLQPKGLCALPIIHVQRLQYCAVPTMMLCTLADCDHMCTTDCTESLFACSWGMSVSDRDGRMRVAQVDKAGLVQQWNAAHSHNQVQVDTIVLEVNGTISSSLYCD